MYNILCTSILNPTDLSNCYTFLPLQQAKFLKWWSIFLPPFPHLCLNYLSQIYLPLLQSTKEVFTKVINGLHVTNSKDIFYSLRPRGPLSTLNTTGYIFLLKTRSSLGFCDFVIPWFIYLSLLPIQSPLNAPTPQLAH